MKVKKLIIPAAGWGTRFLPLTKTVHKELVPILNKPAIDYLVEEAIDSGIEEIWLIISPRKEQLLEYFRVYYDLEEELRQKNKDELLNLLQKTNFDKSSKIKIGTIYQDEQLGLGHAISLISRKIKNEPFAVILGDDLIYSPNKPAIKQLIDEFNKKQASILGVTSVPWENVNKYGIVVPKNLEEKNEKVFEIASAVEKPDVKNAPSNKAIIGRYVFTPEIVTLLKQTLPGVGGEIQLVDAFPELMKTQKIFAFELEGTRYDLGSIEGFVKANIDYALNDLKIKQSIIEHIKEKKL
ncbi:UTP--glucose-1-phosphate uridylyltransferase [Mesomycoplasma lagogenitalium]|uniref:UTP--glucose-1-phosphate uridylyltransferase n=1 Tax=Mesomycoplasma lagogenitalium TaxID=171286 RepID=A0ABY8LTN7_9BACT|nr:UTP--glucose-1-phosphate uridylyltransferase [Mesomycoplasma lagogenitalium]WGI36606.1 UTP--glucose-1-phosphate uridylyltransferase [Mesomycoplasma lagogenitalium]